MSERKSRGNRMSGGRWIFALATLAALVLALAGSSRAQAQSTASKSAPASTPASAKVATANTAPGTQAATPSPAAKPASLAGQSAPKGQHEGITVHGHWTIEVRNPDGKLVKHIEFENGIAPLIGESLLMALMLGQNSPGAWAIGLGPSAQTGTAGVCNTTGGQLVAIPGTFYSECFLTESGDQYFQTCNDANGCFSGLNVTAPTGAVNGPVQGLTLAGQMTVEASGTITSVSTMLMTCPSTVALAACPTTPNPTPTLASFPPLLNQLYPSNLQGDFPFGIPLTITNLPATGCGGANQPPCQVKVGPGQVVSASVVISFQ